MPCDSSYMEANQLEVHLSRTLMLLDELKTGKPVDTKSKDWDGYMAGVYCAGDLRKRADEATAELCDKLKKTVDVSKYSLEMQMWWRDHQEADRAREAKEKEAKAKEKLRATAMKKLTDKERDALGLA